MSYITIGDWTVDFDHNFARPRRRFYLNDGSVIEPKYSILVDGDKWQTNFSVSGTIIELPANIISRIEEFIVSDSRGNVGYTTCILRDTKNNRVWLGEAQCGREDRYSRRTGRTIAFLRAMVYSRKDNFENGIGLSAENWLSIYQAFENKNFPGGYGESTPDYDLIESASREAYRFLIS